MKRRRKQRFIVDHGTYPFDVMVCVGCTPKEIVAALHRRGYQPTEEEIGQLWMRGLGRTVMLKSGATVLRIDCVVGSQHWEAVLAHEVFHAVEFLFDRIGLRYSNKSAEAWAYQLQYLTGSIYQRLI